MSSIGGVGDHGPHTIQSTDQAAEAAASQAESAAPPDGQELAAADPKAAHAAWQAHSSDPGAAILKGELGSVTTPDDVDFKPDWLSMDEFYASMPSFIRALDGALEKVTATFEHDMADGAAPSQQAGAGAAAQQGLLQQPATAQQAQQPQQAQQASATSQQAAPGAATQVGAQQRPAEGGVPAEVREGARALAEALKASPPDPAKVRQAADALDNLVLDWLAAGDPERRAQLAQQLGHSVNGGGAVGGEIPSDARTRAQTPPGYQLLDAARAGNYVRAGSSGPQVEAMQSALNRAGVKPPLEVNGQCGPEMEAAIRRFQEQSGCKVDGIVGPETMGALDVALGLPRRSGPGVAGPSSGGAAGRVAQQPITPVQPGQANGPGALQAAISQIGVREASGNNDGIPAERYSYGHNSPWCANFVAWSFRQAGTPLPGNQRSLGGCDYMMGQMKSNGLWFDRGARTPQPGDIIFFGHPGDSTHVGIVESVEGGRVHTVEGNTGNRCARRSYDLNASRILGYGRP